MQILGLFLVVGEGKCSESKEVFCQYLFYEKYSSFSFCLFTVLVFHKPNVYIIAKNVFLKKYTLLLNIQVDCADFRLILSG